MTHYDPAVGMTFVVVDSLNDNPCPIMYFPSIMGDSTAAADALFQEESAKSFMQTQWRSSAANLNDLGIIASGWA
jgi:hypothetical protein